MILVQKIYRYPYSRFVFTLKNDKDYNYEWGEGFYVSKSGLFCRIYYHGAFKDRGPSTTFDVQYNEFSYTKTYRCSFSNHGMQMIAARMIKDILNAKFLSTKN